MCVYVYYLYIIMYYLCIHIIFYIYIYHLFIFNTRLKLSKNQANGKQQTPRG